MQYLHLPLTSCINYPIYNIRIKGHAKTNTSWFKFTLGELLTSKCNMHIGVMPKPHVEHDTCNM